MLPCNTQTSPHSFTFPVINTPLPIHISLKPAFPPSLCFCVYPDKLSSFQCSLLYRTLLLLFIFTHKVHLSSIASLLVEKLKKKGTHLFKAMKATWHIKAKLQSFYSAPQRQQACRDTEHFSTKDSATAMSH